MTTDCILPPDSQRVVPIFEHIARAHGCGLAPGCAVLDFGAGAGRHVAEFLTHGYNAVGVDQQQVSHVPGSAASEFLRVVEPPDYILPFDDGSFDFVYSTSVMEHVIDPGGALAEIARVLRAGGVSIHVFPSRWRPVEPHMFTPLGGRFQSFALFRLWAALGVRNNWQQGFDATEVALRNVQYAKSGISYPTAAEWELRARRHFRTVVWAERAFIEGSVEVSGVSRRLTPLLWLPGLARLYRGFHTRVLLLRH